jgi:maleylacetoacetate isomerase
VRIALALKGVAYDYVPVNIGPARSEQFTPAYRALNAQSRVPTLEIDGLVLTQSLAIIEYLDDTIAAPPLLPRDAASRARVRSLAELIAADIQPLQNTGVMAYLAERFGADEAGVKRWRQEWIGRGLTALETRLAGEHGTGRYCHGDIPTLADCCLVPQCFAARRFGVDLAAFPTISRIDTACVALPAFQAAAPERQPDART